MMIFDDQFKDYFCHIVINGFYEEIINIIIKYHQIRTLFLLLIVYLSTFLISDEKSNTHLISSADCLPFYISHF